MWGGGAELGEQLALLMPLISQRLLLCPNKQPLRTAFTVLQLRLSLCPDVVTDRGQAAATQGVKLTACVSLMATDCMGPWLLTAPRPCHCSPSTARNPSGGEGTSADRWAVRCTPHDSPLHVPPPPRCDRDPARMAGGPGGQVGQAGTCRRGRRGDGTHWGEARLHLASLPEP